MKTDDANEIKIDTEFLPQNAGSFFGASRKSLLVRIYISSVFLDSRVRSRTAQVTLLCK